MYCIFHGILVMSLPENDSREAPRWTKWAVSVVIALHFFAILTAVTGLGVGYAPPPRLCAEANQKFAPYLELVFLQNPYRFYAPNPGCDPTMWVRIRYSDGNVQWLEFPGPSESCRPGAATTSDGHASHGGRDCSGGRDSR